MNYTDIEWCDMTWNPFTGCLHGCEYCYARRQVKRFEGHVGYVRDFGKNGLHDLDVQAEKKTRYGDYRKAPYPYGFDPTFHRYRLSEPARKKAPQNIFVVSMGDLFGNWVPDEWIKAVFEACEAAPWHNYMFLTKNPKRYEELCERMILPDGKNFWFGWSETGQSVYEGFEFGTTGNIFISIEPLLEEPRNNLWAYDPPSLVIIGAETGNRKNKVVPEREWIESIVEQCREAEIPVFMKGSLRVLMGGDFVQEYPWEV